MMRFLSLHLLILLAVIGCSAGTGTKDCNGANDCTNLPSSGNIPSLRNLSLICEGSHYFDANTVTWREINMARIIAGDIGTLSIYSDTMATPMTEALDSVIASEIQFSDSESLLKNKIPYLKCRANPGEKFFIEYKRYDSSNNIQALVKGEMDVVGGYAYLPLVNEKLDNQLFTTSVGSSSSNSFNHQISIQAKSTDSNPSEVKVIKFKVDVKIPLKGVKVEYSPQLLAFNLKNRWSSYFNTSDYIANDNWDFASLVDDQENADSIPFDVRFVFKTPPVLKMRQKLFVEETIDLLLYKTTGVKFASRGARYVEKNIELDSANHFRSKFKINGTPVTLVSGTSAEMRDIPAGTKWKLTFTYDFSKNAAYSTAHDLLMPLRTECLILTNTRMYPIQEMILKANTQADGGFYASCHPDTDTALNLNAAQLATNNLPLTDIWYDYFSYRKANALIDTPSTFAYDAGHFYGISNVEFYVEGCFKFYTREASALTTNPYLWEPKNIPDSECGSGDFTHFSINAGDSIFDHINEHQVQADLLQVINGLGSIPAIERTDFIFNNSTDADVIY